MNEIVFPAGMLQSPYFDPEAEDAKNYGSIGAVIGHELTHGFDDNGAQFDAKGNLTEWWTPEDYKRFQERAECVVNQFDAYKIDDTLHLTGKLVVGESIADLGGLLIAYRAFEHAQAAKPAAVRNKKIDGFTPEQRFFLSYAHSWAEHARPESERLQVTTDPHPPSKFRVNGPLSNLPEFRKAFGCKTGDVMVRSNPSCAIW
jgi:predicted metalloendopeptidase